ncbi:uncharacterized protein LOC127805026 [Diospyros lotus]|uniref:uncharacterized protein LOC127805026 n=1 Tax=Diospyros lotus TaxID=55363 RepID=UPI00224FEBAB|nr:uncharacterized protein LOC127805026 [Diospyros lotus]
MKQMGVEPEGGSAKLKQAPLPPPPSPPLPTYRFARKPAVLSVTNQEIAEFWKQKRIKEEDHLLAAIKAAAHVRARKLSEDDYKCFVASLDEHGDSKEEDAMATSKGSREDDNHKELRVGIKDWWTKSKYAYLNHPAIESTTAPRSRASTYIPNFCNYHRSQPPPTTTFGIF